MRQRSWNSISAWLRVLTNTSVVLLRLDQFVDFRERVAGRVAGPGQALARVQHLDDGRGGAAGDDDVGGFAVAVALRHQETRQRFRLRHGRRQPDGAHLRRQLPQPRQPERQQIAALGRHQRMQFVEHDALELRKQKRRVVGRQQQRQLLGRGEQDVRRIAPLPLPPRHRRVAGAGLDLDRQPHLGDRRLQVARDIDRERLQRRDVERVQAAAPLHAAPGGDEAGREESPRHALFRRLSPLPPRAKRVVGRGRGWGVLQQAQRQHGHESPRRHPPPPTPPHRFAGEGRRARRGSERRADRDPRRSRSIPPASAEIPPASCRRRWARSTARSGRRGPWPATQADARAATSRAPRTSGGNGPAAVRPVRESKSSGCGAAQPRAMPPAAVSSRGGAGQRGRPSRRTLTPCR